MKLGWNSFAIKVENIPDALYCTMQKEPLIKLVLGLPVMLLNVQNRPTPDSWGWKWDDSVKEWKPV